MRDDLVERLFSLLTSADRAEAMAGDLIQERQHRGSRWFWWHAFVTAVALWGTAVAKAPLRTLLVAAAGCALLAMPVIAGVAAVSLFPTLLGALVAWSVLATIWWGGALWTGASVVAIAPARGLAACLTLVALGEALLLALWISGVQLDLLRVTTGIIYTTAAGAACPLLLGAAVVRDRVSAWARHTQERHS
jgi:hypothetical protein